MRGQFVALAGLLAGTAAAAQPVPSAEERPRTAEQFIETAREVYSVREPRSEPCAAPVGNEIVVCRQIDEVPDQRLPSPTERAHAAGDRLPDPIPDAPYVFGLPPCEAYTFCAKNLGRTPPQIYIIDLSKIPEALTPEEAALVFRAEDRPSPEAASPAAAP